MRKLMPWLNLFFIGGICLMTFGLALPALAAARPVPPTTRRLSTPVPRPTSQSLLIILLDRSSSLAATDPSEYSDSIAKVFADLWPGRMAVIFFNGTQKPLPQIGPADLTSAGARAQIKSQIEGQRTNIQGWTPTQAAVEQAEQLLAQTGYPTGSQVVLITDGQPQIPTDDSGTQQIQVIEQQDAPVFSAHQIPISTFGLGDAVPAYARTFLSQIASETGGEHHDVTNPAQLAQPVLQMYANWLGLSFVRTAGHNIFPIDTYAGLVNFVAFLQNSNTYPVTLLSPNHQPVPAQELQDRSLDIHYEFDRLIITEFNQAGFYTIQTSDPTAQTYALEQTRLRTEIVSPTSHTPVYAGKPLTVSVALYDQNPRQYILPNAGDAVIGMKYTLTANGKTVESGKGTLKQGTGSSAGLFSAQITPKQTGTLTISIVATYQFIPVLNQPAITLTVTTPPPPPCPLTEASCLVQRYGTAFSLGLLLLLLLLAVLWIWSRPSPFGVFKTTEGSSRVLGSNRSLTRRLLHKSTLFAEELRTVCPGARFNMHFKRGQAFLVAQRGGAALEIWPATAREGENTRAAAPGVQVRLRNGDRLAVDGQPCSTFYESLAKARQAEQAGSFDFFNV